MDEFIEKFPEDCAYFGIGLPPKSIIEKCAEIAQSNNLNSEEFSEQWITFTVFNNAKKDDTTPNDQNLELFERYLVEQSEKQSKKKTKELAKTSNVSDPVISSYSNSPSEKKRTRDENNGDIQDAKRVKEDKRLSKFTQDESRDNLNLSSSMSLSMNVSTIESEELGVCEKFSDRKEPLKVQETFCLNQELRNKATFKHSGAEGTIIVKKLGNEPFDSNTLLYFDVKLVKRHIVTTKIDNLGKYLIKKYNLEDAVPYITLPYRPDESIVYGQICKTDEGKMDKTSITLESSFSVNMGESSTLDLYTLEDNTALFPGQVVAISAHKGRQGAIGANKIYTDATLDLPKEIPKLNITGPMQIVIACGPFTMKNNLSYEPLITLMAYIHEHRPHVLILMGPFLSEHENQMFDETYESQFEGLINGLMANLEKDNCNTQVVIVSSSKDLHHSNVYPTPPYEIEIKHKNLHFMPDPSVIDINGLKIGATSTDILFHLNKEELFISKKGHMLGNRMARIVEDIISQQSFYPLYPANKEVCLDVNLFSKHGYFTETPHILILPSILRYFVKDIKGCVVINPEKLTKGCTGGTFARLEINPNITSNSVANDIVCEILNI